MSRITGKDAANLIEAYNSLYAPQEEVELTEEQVQEDFENWVNSLVEEGYDLSEYTWEDMYEEYLNEYAAGGVPGSGGAVTMYSRPAANTGSSYQSRFARPMNAGTPQRTGRATPVSRPQIGGLPSNYRGQELQQAARARASQVGTPRQGTAGGPTVGGNTPIGPTRTTAPVARPATPAAPATRPAAQPVGSARPTPAPQKPTATATPPGPPSRYNPLMQRTFGYQTGNAPSQIAAASQGTTQSTSDAAFKKSREAVNKMRSTPTLSQSFDIFDIVKGYLIDEGYAETEEAAAVIMANMSDEWRQSIIEAGLSPAELEAIAREAAGKKKKSKKIRPGMAE